MSAVPLWASEGGGLKSVFEMGLSSRSLGLGGAGVAVSDEGAFFLRNPAALASQHQKEFSTFHTSLFVDTLYDAVGYAHPFGRGTIGLSVARVATSDVPLTVDSVIPVSQFDAAQWQGTLGFGTRVWRGLSAGADVKYRRLVFGSRADSGMGLDAGLLYRFSRNPRDLSRFSYKNLSLACSASNLLPPEIRLDADADRPPLLVRPGLAFHYLSRSMRGSLWVALEAEIVKGGDLPLRGGLEYGWRQRLFLRGGWDGEGPTAGGGLALRGLRLDYAFGKPELGALHRFSLSYRFGRVADVEQNRRLQTLKVIAKTYDDAGEYNQSLNAWRKVLQEFPEDPEALAAVPAVEKKRRKAIEERLKKAKDAMARNDIPSAVPDITFVLNLDPENQEARALMRQMDLKLLISQNYMQGLEAYQADDYVKAVRYLELVRMADPQYRDTARLYSEAKSRLTPLESFPKDAMELYAAGVDHFVKGRYEKAIESWEKVLAIMPGHYMVQRNIAEARERLAQGPAPAATPPKGKGTP